MYKHFNLSLRRQQKKKKKILLIHTVMQGVCAFAMFDFLSLSGVFTLITTY